MKDLKLEVSVEKSVHKALNNVLQDAWDKYGLRVDNVSARWVNISTVGEPEAILTELTLSTTSMGGK